jgi:AraC-like DNA-binding protein
MKKIKHPGIKAVSTSNLITNVKAALNATLVTKLDMQILTVDEKLGNGKVEHVDFKNGISFTQYDILVYEDLSFQLEHSDKDYIYLFYGLEGECYHNFKTKEKHTLIEEFRTTVINGNKNQNNIITLRKNKTFKYSVISIEKNKFFKKFEDYYDIPKSKMINLYNAFKNQELRVHQCSHNLKIADQLRFLKKVSTDFKVTHLMYYESHFKMILSIHLEHFYNETYEKRIISALSKTELKKIRTITEFIIDHPELHHTIKSLCAKAILSPVKLQEGFKCTHGTTVSNYIKNTRVERARDLLIYSDYNVSEVAYMVGFTSRSYFCKIFKEKFKCNATAYRDKYKDKTVSLSKI